MFAFEFFMRTYLGRVMREIRRKISGAEALRAPFANGLLLAARWELVDHEISRVLERFRKSLGILRGKCMRRVVVKLDNHCLVIH